MVLKPNFNEVCGTALKNYKTYLNSVPSIKSMIGMILEAIVVQVGILLVLSAMRHQHKIQKIQCIIRTPLQGQLGAIQMLEVPMVF